MRFLIDEDLPRSLARILREAGLDAVDVRDIGLRGASDRSVFARAVAERRVLLSGDLGFANTLDYPLGSHAGIGVVRFPSQVSSATLNAAVLDALGTLADADLDGALLIVEPGKVRLRQPREPR